MRETQSEVMEVCVVVVKKQATFVLLAVLAVVLTGCFGTPSFKNPQQTEYSVQGSVTDASTGKGVAGVTIYYSGADVSGAATTGSDGKYTLSGLKGEVTITPVSQDYTFEPSERRATFGTRGQSFDFIAIAKPKGGDDDDNEKEYQLRVALKDKNGNPFTEAYVYACSVDADCTDMSNQIPGVADDPPNHHIFTISGLKGKVRIELMIDDTKWKYQPITIDPDVDDVSKLIEIMIEEK